MNTEEINQLWAEVCSRVKSYEGIIGPQVDALFSQLFPQAASDGFMMLTANTEFIKNFIERHYIDYIKRALEEIRGVPFDVLIGIDESQAPAAAPAAPAPATAPAPAPQMTAQTTATTAADPVAAQQATVPATATMPATEAPPAMPAQTTTQPTPGQPAAQTSASVAAPAAVTEQQATAAPIAAPASAPEQQAAPTPVAPNPEDPAPQAISADSSEAGQPAPNNSVTSTLTFENFVIGDSNRMAYSMAVSVAETPGKPHLNPLFIYGRSGLGKTHLLRAIQNYINSNMPNLQVVYKDSNELLEDYMDASAAHDTEKSSYKNFKMYYEEADVLLVDDVQQLQGKKQTLDIMFQIFNKLTSQGKQVVLSADRAPKNIDIDERYKTRFNSGGTFDIQPPEIETKLSIVKSFIREYEDMEQSGPINMPEDVQICIAESSGSNIRELKSAVTNVIVKMKCGEGSDITVADVRKLLENHFSGGPSKRLTADDILKVTEDFFKVSHTDIVGKKRTRNIAHARQTAIYLCRQLLDIPYGDIGKKFNRDHSTIMYSVGNIEAKMKENRVAREEMEALRQIIREL
ncbi:chromosomal replication initiator protein DnaA [uncultured Senegalimassilia sp.]|uniref:chromosomal replication initiator protein DnaA n=1 Tax=uncultured Senegalimassilia sp. TaxID=1714350 RepID=UPI002610BBCB|nr:chromosomal replication initiator protein DnaA [uncultured Senegalimassilia sp.]